MFFNISWEAKLVFFGRNGAVWYTTEPNIAPARKASQKETSLPTIHFQVLPLVSGRVEIFITVYIHVMSEYVRRHKNMFYFSHRPLTFYMNEQNHFELPPSYKV